MAREHPSELYKYIDLTGKGIDHVEDLLRNNRVWFSSPTKFNDPFECGCVYDIGASREEVVSRKYEILARKGASVSDSLVQAEQDIPRHPSQFDGWKRQQVMGHVRRVANTGILCLTHLCNNQPMWAQYAKGHTGVCIQFRARSMSEDSHIDFIGDAQPVEYADQCPLIDFVRDDRFDITRKAFLTKTLQYNYEEEWRIVRYDDGSGLKSIPKGIIGRVILGVKIEPKNRERIIHACAKYDGDIEIVQAALDPETYGLQFKLERTV